MTAIWPVQILNLIPQMLLFTETTNSQSNMSTEMSSNATANSNWAGEYEGVFPCADCEGIKVELDLNPDKTYELSEEYLT